MTEMSPTRRGQRQWPRALLTVARLLLAGAIVNIAVAWTLVGAPDSWTPGGPVAVDAIAPFGEGAAARRKAGDSIREALWAPPSWGPAGWVKKRRGLGWTTTDVVAGGFVPDLNWHGIRVDCGWPARSLAWVSRLRHDEERDEWQRHTSAVIDVPLHLMMDSGWFEYGSSRDAIPLTPIIPGFAINTLFYAGLLALPLGVSLARSRGRPPAASADSAPQRWRRRRWVAPCIIAAAIAPGIVLALMGSRFGAALVVALLASIVLWTVLLAAVAPAGGWERQFPAAVVMGIVSQFAGVVAMALLIRAFIPA